MFLVWPELRPEQLSTFINRKASFFSHVDNVIYSRFPIDTTDGKEIPERQLSNLWLQLRDGALRTEGE